MKQAALPEMTVDEFLVWSERQLEGRYELFDGEIVRQSHDGVSLQAEKILHVRVKGNVFAALRSAVAEERRPCETLMDGAAVRIDGKTAYEPDVLVYCGERPSPQSIEVPNPIIVVEVLSEGTATRDMRDKLAGYMTIPSIQHYLIVDPEKPLVIHYARDCDGQSFHTRLLSEGSLTLKPPGLTLAIADFFNSSPQPR